MTVASKSKYNSEKPVFENVDCPFCDKTLTVLICDALLISCLCGAEFHRFNGLIKVPKGQKRTLH